MNDPFETPDGFAWTFPVYVLFGTDGSIMFRRAGGFRCVPVFTDRDGVETFVERSGIPADDVEAYELPDMMALLKWVDRNLAADCAMMMDPISAEPASLRVVPVGPYLDELKRQAGETG